MLIIVQPMLDVLYHHQVACDDNPKQDMRQHFSGCIRFIHETRVRNVIIIYVAEYSSILHFG